MIKTLLWIGGLLLVSTTAYADWLKDLAKDPEVMQARISPKGDYLSAIKIIDDKRALVIFKFPEMKISSVMSFPGRNEVGTYLWVSNDRVVASIVQEYSSREEPIGRGELFAMSADGSKPEHIFGYRAGADVGSKGYVRKKRNEYGSATVVNELWDDPEHILINIRYWFSSFNAVVESAKLNIYNGKLSDRVKAPAPNAQLVADRKGNIRFSFSMSDDFESVIHIRDTKSGDWTEYSRTPYGSHSPAPASFPENGKMYVRYAPDDGPEGIYLQDMQTSEKKLIYRHAFADAIALDDHEGNIYGAWTEGDKPQFTAIDVAHPISRLMAGLTPAFPNGVPVAISATHDYKKVVISIIQPDITPEYYLYDADKNQLGLLFDSHPWIDDARLAKVTPVKLKARDGMELHGYLSLPPGSAGKNMPMILVPHGGPHGPRDTWAYPWFEGFIPSSGYAMLQVNYRGSGGYGPSFESSGFGKWATTMQDDLTDSVRWAIDQGIADPERICIFGWSYGGYAALMSIIREPDLYKCSVGGAGVYDQEIQYTEADFSSFTRWGPKYMDKVIGPTAEDRRLASPITYVDRIKTPVMLVHGEDDLRVPVEHAKALMNAMKKAGKPVEKYIELKNEAHSPRKDEHIEQIYREILKFFEKYIGPGERPQAVKG